MEGEDFKTLEAALALIEECDDVSSTASSSDGGDTMHSGSAELMFQPTEQEASEPSDRISSDRREIQRLKAKLVFPGRNRSRDLHRLELLELRVEAAVLQQRIDDLEEEHRRRRPRAKMFKVINSGEEISMAETTDDRLYDAWRNLAKKHKRLRRSAEIENRDLRELYTRQLKTTSTFKKLFRKQASIKEQLEFR